MKKVLCQLWEESERGWGVRSDGFSLHKDEAAVKKFVDEHWTKQPKDYVPDEYDRPCGTAYTVNVPNALYKLICESNGVKFYSPKNGPEREGRFPEAGVYIRDFMRKLQVTK